jgi:hypothetical protein
MLNAANMPLFRQRYSVVKDALGNQRIFDLRRGGFVSGNGSPGAGGGSSPDTSTSLAQTPVALAKRAEEEQAASNKKLESLQEASVQGGMLRDKANEALKLLDNPDVSQGGFADWKQEGKNAIAGLTGGTVTLPGTDEGGKFQKLAAQLQGQYLSGQKGVRFAGPEIKFSETANPDMDKPREVNRQILHDSIRQADLMNKAYVLGNRHMKDYGVLGPKFNDELNALYAPGASAQLDAAPVKNALPKGVKSIQVIQ